MAGHRRQDVQKILAFLGKLGQILGYHVVTEEPMFPGEAASSLLDMTWRKHKDAKFPLFIFEVDSKPTKSAPDNAVKVFARKTPDFEKPLFFFHIFLASSPGRKRLEYLAQNFDRLNYRHYVLDTGLDGYRLVSDVLDQHFRIEPRLDLSALVALFESADGLGATTRQILDKLVTVEYDRSSGASFLLTLESLIVEEGYESVREFYVPYLKQYLGYEKHPAQPYYYSTPAGYGLVIHHALLLLLDPEPDYRRTFDLLLLLEREYDPWPLWEPTFGLSHDHDDMLVSEFPVLLTLLCASFAPTPHSRYFSGKLRNIMLHARHPRDVHGLIWALIASQVASDKETYDFARSRLDSLGGVRLSQVLDPSPFVASDEQEDLVGDSERVSLPEYDRWAEWLTSLWTAEDVDILVAVIEGLLVMNNPEEGRACIARLCLRHSLRPHLPP